LLTLVILLSLSTALLAGLSLWLYFRFSFTKAELDRTLRDEPLRYQAQRKEWENLSQHIVDVRSQQMQEQQKMSLSQVIEPLQKELERLQHHVNESTRLESMREERILQSLHKVVELNHHLGHQADSLAKALKGDNKIVGDYGETLLERLLEYTGLRKDEHYILQGIGLGLQSEQGGALKPDVLILLPEKRCIVVDAKMSLQAWSDAQNAEDSLRTEALERLKRSTRNHILDLASKPYVESLDKIQLQGLDTKFLFIPIEAAFHTLLQIDSDLYRFAFSKGIILVSPTTLLASLTTVQHTWKQYDIGRNAQEISQRASLLLDKLHDFMSSMEDIGKYLHKAEESYLMARKRLSEGQGNLLSQAEKLQDLGAKGRVKSTLFSG